jgi:hypothetical protein
VIETKLLEVIRRLETVVETNPVQIIRAST